MRRALANLSQSVGRIESVAAEMRLTPLTAPPAVRESQETMRCAAVVILSGFLESFVKDCAEAFIREVCKRKVGFADLPKRTRLRHFDTGGRLLGQKVRRNSRVAWISASEDDMVVRLSSPAHSPASYTLLWEAFATTEGNPSPRVLIDILGDLGVDKAVEKLNQHWGGNYESMRLSLQSFIDVRNECAHTGSSSSVPTTGSLEDYCMLVRRFAEAIVEVLEERLGQAPFGVDLNLADLAVIKKLPYVGSKASKVVAFRLANGPFRSLADLKSVEGFGEKLVRRLRLYAHVA